MLFSAFQKIYSGCCTVAARDEGTAAEDTAFVFFRVWGLSVDARLYVTAASFGGACHWERAVPVE